MAIQSKPTRHEQDWTEEELLATVQAYRTMQARHERGQPFVKKHYYQSLEARFSRKAGAYERRMQNISALLAANNLPWLPGLKPQANIGGRITNILTALLADIFSDLNAVAIPLPEEVTTPETVFEGAKKQITVNAYERDSSARLACIQHWGESCTVCGFNFSAVYGELGAGFIHVHHLRPLSTIGQEYRLDPAKDLRPVCPNCHAMLHRQKEVLSLEELKAIRESVLQANGSLPNRT